MPVPSLRPALDRCKPTGVALGKGTRVVVAADEGGVATALAVALEKSGVTVLSLDGATPTDEVTSRLGGWLKDGPVQGVFWLPALDVEPAIAEMDLAAFREANRRRVKNLHAAHARAVRRRGRRRARSSCRRLAWAASTARRRRAPPRPLGGAVAGFTKAYKRERGEALVKVVDFAPDAPAAEVAEALIAEALADPGVVEVGRHDGPALRRSRSRSGPPPTDSPACVLTKDSVFVVTGAAGGITSAIVADLAAASGGTFYLLDLVAEPARDDPKIALLRAGPRGAEARADRGGEGERGEKPTPVAIDRQIMAVERSEAALRAIESVEAAGGTALWRSANLLDGEAIARGRRGASARRTAASTCWSTPAASRSAASCPRRKPASSTSSSTSRPTASSAC